MSRYDHRYYENSKMNIAIGDELFPAELKPGGVYIISYQLSDKKVELYQCSKSQWGIIVLNHEGKVFRSWNVKTPNAWCTKVHGIGRSYHIYEAPEMMKQFADRSWDADTYAAHCKNLEEKMRRDNEMRYKLDKHWLRRLANRLIIFFS